VSGASALGFGVGKQPSLHLPIDHRADVMEFIHEAIGYCNRVKSVLTAATAHGTNEAAKEHSRVALNRYGKIMQKISSSSTKCRRRKKNVKGGS